MKNQGLAKILKAEIPDYLADSNEDNDRLDVKLTIRYLSSNDGKTYEGLSDKALSLLENLIPSDYTLLIDLTRLGVDKSIDTSEAEKIAREKLEGETLPFTSYKYSIAELLKDELEYKDITAVNNGERSYSSFSTSFVGYYDNDESVFEDMRANLLDNLATGNYEAGRLDEKKQDKRGVRSRRR